MEQQSLIIRVRQHAGHVLVTVAGEVDLATAGALREKLAPLATSGRGLIIDLDQVTFIDASGLGVLAGTGRRAAAHGGRLRLVCGRPQTRRLLHLTRLDRPLGLRRTLADALPAGPLAPAPLASGQAGSAGRARAVPSLAGTT